ncbi:MAG: porin family protein [Pseudomonadota bacterium]|nr:porin family protein [Pseudomonadota bacterium]
MTRTRRLKGPATSLGIALCAVSAQALALPPPPYAVVDIGRSRIAMDASAIDEAGLQPTGHHRNATGFGITLGWPFTKHLAAEGTFLELGEGKVDVATQGPPPVTNSRIGVQSYGMLLALAGTWPIHDRLSVEGRAGTYLGKSETRIRGSTGGNLGYNRLLGSDSDFGLAVAVGVVAAFNDTWALRAGYDYIDGAFGKNAGRISLGLRFNWP